MRRFLASMVAVFFCLTAAPAFAGVADPLSIVIGSPVVVSLGSTLDVMGTVTNMTGAPVAFDTGGFLIPAGPCATCFEFMSLVDQTSLGAGQNTGQIFLFSVHHLDGTSAVLPGVQFQLFTSGFPGVVLGTSNRFTVQAVPEPATLLLLGTGLAGLGGVAWRRHRRR